MDTVSCLSRPNCSEEIRHMDATAPMPRRVHGIFQVSLRTILILIGLVAIWLAMVVSRARNQERAVHLVHELGGSVHYDFETTPQVGIFHDSTNGTTTVRGLSFENKRKLSGSPWLRSLIGEHYFQDLLTVHLLDAPFTDKHLEAIARVPTIQWLDLTCTKVTDAGIVHLKKLKNLRVLSLDGTLVSNNCLEHVEHLKQIEQLELGGTRITDEGLQHLSALPKLKYLSLRGNLDHHRYWPAANITDEGLPHLYPCSSLELVCFGNKLITSQARAKLAEQLPGLIIR